MRLISLSAVKCFCTGIGLSVLCLFAEEQKTDPDTLAIRKLAPSQDAERTAHAMQEFGKVFTLRFFNGKADAADLNRLMSVIRENPQSPMLAALLVQAVPTPEQRAAVLPELVKLAQENEENYLLAAAASQMYLVDKKTEEALPLIRSAFRHAIEEKKFDPDRDDRNVRLLVSIIGSYLFLTEKTGHPDETDRTAAYLQQHPEWIDRPDVAAELMLIMEARIDRRKELLPTPFGFVYDQNYVQIQNANHFCDLFLAAVKRQKDSLKLPQIKKLIRVLSASGRSGPALQFLLEQLVDHPQDVELLELLAEFYAGRQQFLLAAHACEAAMRTPKPPKTLWLRAYFFYRLADELEDASRMLEDFLRKDPQNEWAKEEFQELCITRDDLPRALALQRSKPLSYNRIYIEALLLYEMQQYEAAFRTIKAAEQYLKDHKQKLKSSEQMLTMYALCAEKAGWYKTLEEVTLRMLKELPNTPDILNFVGYVWADHEMRLEEALGYLERAVKAEPDNAAYLDSLAWVLYRLKRYPESREIMTKCLAKNKEKDSVILEHAGDIELKCGDVKRAVAYWREALDASGECNFAVLQSKISEYEKQVK